MPVALIRRPRLRPQRQRQHQQRLPILSLRLSLRRLLQHPSERVALHLPQREPFTQFFELALDTLAPISPFAPTRAVQLALGSRGVGHGRTIQSCQRAYESVRMRVKTATETWAIELYYKQLNCATN